MTQSYFGDNLYSLRKSKGISQDEFAENLGVSRQAVSKWERNEAYPDTENLIAIAKFFNVTIDDLINTPINIDQFPVPDETQDESDEENDQDDDEGDEDEEDDESSKPSVTSYILSSVPFAIVATIIYMLLGFFVEDGWRIGWTIFVLIPVYDSMVYCIRQKCFSGFAYPVFVTFIFLLFGMLYGIWHPLWVLYLTVPVYYPIASAIDKPAKKSQ